MAWRDEQLREIRRLRRLDTKMRDWILEHKADPDVKQWLRDNPPPRGWLGTKMEYAYTEMPVGLFTGRAGRLL